METGPRLVIALVLLLALGLGTVEAAQQGTVAIQSVSYVGQGEISTDLDRMHLWQSETHRFEVAVDRRATSKPFEVCLVTGERELVCRTMSIDGDGTSTVSLALNDWPSTLTGSVALQAVVREPSSGAVLDNRTLALTVIRKSADPDGDGLPNQVEMTRGTDYLDVDTDADALGDGVEVQTYGTDPLNQDSDGDELEDGAEVDVYQTDPAIGDTDGDGLTDGIEVMSVGSDPNSRDTDFDGLDDAAEVNTFNTNVTEADTDGDGLGDGAEVDTHRTNPTKADTDGDGLSDGREVTIIGSDPTQRDTDGDGLTDRDEVERYGTDPTVPDTDDDGVSDGAEVTVHDTNPNAVDTDHDGLADRSEIRRGTNPLVPTAAPQRTLIDRIIGFLGTPVGSAVTGLFVLLLGAMVVQAYRTGVSTADLREWVEIIRSGETVGDTSEEVEIDPTMLTNEEHIRHLLQRDGGRMLQSDIVTEGEWSKATVSRVLSEMEAEGVVRRIDIGKGNLVTLPEDDPDDL